MHHFFAGYSSVVFVLDSSCFHLGDKKVVAGHIIQVVALYRNDCNGIGLGGLSIGRL